MVIVQEICCCHLNFFALLSFQFIITSSGDCSVPPDSSPCVRSMQYRVREMKDGKESITP